MIITIVQAEIEQAITDYVKKQVNIREGMAISIDLKATRGAEGMQATIDITVATDAPAKTVTSSQAEVVEVSEKVLLSPSSVSTTREWPIASEDTPAEKEEPKPTGKSLFAGLNKPVNTKAEAE